MIDFTAFRPQFSTVVYLRTRRLLRRYHAVRASVASSPSHKPRPVVPVVVPSASVPLDVKRALRPHRLVRGFFCCDPADVPRVACFLTLHGVSHRVDGRRIDCSAFGEHIVVRC